MREKIKPMAQDDGVASEDGKRQRSKIAFPYTDFGSAADIAEAIHDNVGSGSCSQAQLAAWTNQSVKSSGFRAQIAAARLFGVVESAAGDGLRLAELGRRIVDPAQARAAKAEAFLRVPLFKALYDLHHTGVTPPSAALEKEIAQLGVALKQKAKARQVFESSAQQTGFRDVAPNKLVLPGVLVKAGGQEDHGKRKTGGDGGGHGDLELDPLLMALIRKIPKDTEWSAENRLRWFRTFAMNVSQVYDSDEEPVELEINLKDLAG